VLDFANIKSRKRDNLLQQQKQSKDREVETFISLVKKIKKSFLLHMLCSN